jgi:AcrR family transcriptional regulator
MQEEAPSPEVPPGGASAVVDGSAEFPASPLAADLTEFVREPQQARSRRTLERIIASAHRLLSREGPDGLTVTGLAREAGASVGSFYARFEGREELIRYLGERDLAEALTAWNAVAAAAREGREKADPLLPILARHLIEAFHSGPLPRLRALDGEEDPAPSRIERFQQKVLSDLARLLLSGDESGRRDAGREEFEASTPLGSEVAAHLLLAGAGSLAGGEWGVSSAELARELARAVGGYLDERAAEPGEALADPDERPAAPDAPAATPDASAAESDEPGEAPDVSDEDPEEPREPEEMDLFDVWN